MPASADDHREQLAALRCEFADVMGEHLDHVGALWRRLSERWDDEALSELGFCVHRVRGSAGSFGYREVSQAALALERWLCPWIESGRFPDPEDLAEGQTLVERMRRGAEG